MLRFAELVSQMHLSILNANECAYAHGDDTIMVSTWVSTTPASIFPHLNNNLDVRIYEVDT